MSHSSANRDSNPVRSGELLGKMVFTLTTIAMLVFFWWLLIYDHGVSLAQ